MMTASPVDATKLAFWSTFWKSKPFWPLLQRIPRQIVEYMTLVSSTLKTKPLFFQWIIWQAVLGCSTLHEESHSFGVLPYAVPRQFWDDITVWVLQLTCFYEMVESYGWQRDSSPRCHSENYFEKKVDTGVRLAQWCQVTLGTNHSVELCIRKRWLWKQKSGGWEKGRIKKQTRTFSSVSVSFERLSSTLLPAACTVQALRVASINYCISSCSGARTTWWCPSSCSPRYWRQILSVLYRMIFSMFQWCQYLQQLHIHAKGLLICESSSSCSKISFLIHFPRRLALQEAPPEHSTALGVDSICKQGAGVHWNELVVKYSQRHQALQRPWIAKTIKQSGSWIGARVSFLLETMWIMTAWVTASLVS